MNERKFTIMRNNRRFRKCNLPLLLVALSATLSATGSCDDAANDTKVSMDENRFLVPCKTPNDDDGLCTEIQKCPALLKAFTEGKSYAFIRASKCGPANEDIFQFRVCCSKWNDFVDAQKEEEIKPEKVKCPKASYVAKTDEKSPLPNKCGKQKMLFNRIYGGQQALLGEYPWMARLLYKNAYDTLRFGCTGFLVHKKVVLTAAHCIHSTFSQFHGPLSQVQLGEHDTEKEIDCDGEECAPAPVKMKVASTVVHPGYNRTSKSHEHDIALIFLKKHVQFTDYVRPICILDRCITTQHLYVSGWGTTETQTQTNVKMKATVPRVGNEACQSIYGTLNKTISAYQTCAGLNGSDSCKGDSGGPLMVVGNKGKWYAEGIVSYGIRCGTKFPGVYTFLPKYYDWIVSEINKVGETK